MRFSKYAVEVDMDSGEREEHCFEFCLFIVSLRTHKNIYYLLQVDKGQE